ncbi:uncharacterized protein FJT64_026447 [Amphibalanus amphitrite]|uniref:SANT and BTB domain-containing protein n=1 Tax=Amphibalanus amphitrite TaxID=1232801 RepID=A0A6A4WBK1_AMPAM|nr:uncharacterized protein FJT64_026447 [Amphibalanus amphitrite]
MEEPYPFAALQLLLTSYRLKRWLHLDDEPPPPLPDGCEDVDVGQVQELVETGLLDGLLLHLTEVLGSRPSPAPPLAAGRPRERGPGRGRRRDRDRDQRREFSLAEQDVIITIQLENVDITIHCELAVFGWLIRWLESRSADAAPPEISADVVVSVLSSADFLRMEPLVDECVAFHRR